MKSLLLLLILVSEPDQYVPNTKHLSVEDCAEAIDRESAADCARLFDDRPDRRPGCLVELHASHLRHCQWYGGMDIAEACRKGFHEYETKTTTLDGLPMGRTICVQDGTQP